jgi:hypothetical protein
MLGVEREEIESVGHTVKPLNGRASTHWSCAAQRGLREEKRKWGARVRPERADRVLFAQNRRVTVQSEWMDDDE